MYGEPTADVLHQFQEKPTDVSMIVEVAIVLADS